MSHHYAVRLSRTFQELAGFFDRLASHNIQHIVYEHTADEDVSRTHIHALLLDVKESTDTLKNWVKKTLNVTEYERTDWSFKTTYKKDDVQITITYETMPGFITYMSKGHLQPVLNSAFSDSEVELARNQWKQFSASGASASGASPEIVVVSVQRKTKHEIMGEVANLLRNEGCIMPEDKKIIKAVCKVLRENRIITNMYKLADYVDSYKMWYYGDEFADIVEKYYMQSRYR